MGLAGFEPVLTGVFSHLLSMLHDEKSGACCLNQVGPQPQPINFLVSIFKNLYLFYIFMQSMQETAIKTIITSKIKRAIQTFLSLLTSKIQIKNPNQTPKNTKSGKLKLNTSLNRL